MASAQPHFFVDRSLGRIKVPSRLREAGWSLTTLAEHYGIPSDEAVADVEWLTLAGSRGWAVLMKDDRIRRRPAEVAALRDAHVNAFCIANANLNSDEQVQLLLRHQRAIFRFAGEEGPALFSLSKSGMRQIILE